MSLEAERKEYLENKGSSMNNRLILEDAEPL